jgi:hypothetical protein
VVALIAHARRALDAVRRHDTEIDGVANRLSEAACLVSEVFGDDMPALAAKNNELVKVDGRCNPARGAGPKSGCQ